MSSPRNFKKPKHQPPFIRSSHFHAVYEKDPKTKILHVHLLTENVSLSNSISPIHGAIDTTVMVPLWELVEALEPEFELLTKERYLELYATEKRYEMLLAKMRKLKKQLKNQTQHQN